MMKQILMIFSLIASAFLIFPDAVCAQDIPKGNFESLQKSGIATVTEVVNPITVKLDDGRFINLVGLDFPDLDYYNPGDLSVTTTEILNDYLKGKDVIIYQTKSADEGRINRLNHHLAHLVRTQDNGWVQGLLLSLGLARARTTLYNPEMATQMYAVETAARETQIGLWGMDDYKIRTPEQAKETIGSYQIVEGHVKNVSRNKNTVYLNFGNDWRDDFTVSVSAFDLRKFNAQKIEPQDWNGKRIRVRGWIESYNGPHIKIDHPERVELLYTQSSLPSEEERNPPHAAPIEGGNDPDSALPKLDSHRLNN